MVTGHLLNFQKDAGPGRVTTCRICFASYGSSSSAPCPTFDVEGESSPQYEKEVDLRSLITSLNVARQGPALVLQSAGRAQEICIALGSPNLISADGAQDIMRELKARDAPDALVAVYRDAVKL